MIVRAKIQLLLAARSNEAIAPLVSLLAGRTRGVEGAAVLRALPRGILGESPQGGAGGARAPVDAVVEISGDEGTTWDGLAAPLAGLGDAIDALVDSDRCGVIAGLEHHVMPGDDPIALICPLTRVAALDRAGFQDYWLNRHADFGRRDPAARYRQLHQDTAAAALVAAVTGLPPSSYDGTAEAYFGDVAELAAKLASPEIAQEAFADEQRFIDHARSFFLPFERVSGE
ncbi:EthD domain-containing protein [Sphingomonas profundi]|uniref:EthD domain-containing protein n=1 Tax=Alterirhizorhabdus profundi TaxID=2681549 RepID=UPI0012E859D1|nr:EthD domain-containing protein [Sphingomonas profundi]